MVFQNTEPARVVSYSLDQHTFAIVSNSDASIVNHSNGSLGSVNATPGTKDNLWIVTGRYLKAPFYNIFNSSTNK